MHNFEHYLDVFKHATATIYLIHLGDRLQMANTGQCRQMSESQTGTTEERIVNAVLCWKLY